MEEEEQPEEEEDADVIGEEDEMADFIVDEDEVDETGAPVRYAIVSFTSAILVFLEVSSILHHLFSISNGNLFLVEGSNQRKGGRDKGWVFHHLHYRKPTRYLGMLMSC